MICFCDVKSLCFDVVGNFGIHIFSLVLNAPFPDKKII